MFKEVADMAKRSFQPGECFETTLWGKPPIIKIDGEFHGEIPSGIAHAARHHGLEVIGTDIWRGCYIVKVL